MRKDSFRACQVEMWAGTWGVRETLREYFGFENFRAGQEPVIRALMEGRSALAVFPTGGGKSLCYQVPAMMLDGLTLVVSPLIALMKDQVDALCARGIAAARLDSTLDADEMRRVYERMEEGSLKLLYVAPERFANEAFRVRMKRLKVVLAAIDEAHCISEWGHNFRPDYLKLAKMCRVLKVPRVLCLTATATPKVARDIRKAFRIRVEDHVQLSFHRANLDLRVTPCEAEARKGLLAGRLRERDGAAVVYVTRQETAEEVATYLARQGLAARAYHAGLPAEFRADAQGAFMRGETRVIVATIAFGMGIDKSDIRAVYHYNLPKSLENYVQEIGRAGRDGQEAVCEMLACGDDLTVLENFIHADQPSPRALENLMDRVLRQGREFDVSPYELSTVCDIRSAVVSTVMTYLEMAGVLEVTGSHYAKYKARLLQTQDRIMAGRPAAEVRMIRKLFEMGEEKRGAWWFEPDRIAGVLGVKREKIVALLGELEAAGDLAISVSGVRHRYRMRKELEDMKLLVAEIVERYAEREASDLGRLAQVMGLSAQRGCLTGYLTRHFGERLDGPCGHCDRCRGVPARKLKRSKVRVARDEELLTVRALMAEKHAALATPRQLARFLCGMASPAATRARLTRHGAFGMLADLPFSDVLAIASA